MNQRVTEQGHTHADSSAALPSEPAIHTMHRKQSDCRKTAVLTLKGHYTQNKTILRQHKMTMYSWVTLAPVNHTPITMSKLNPMFLSS